MQKTSLQILNNSSPNVVVTKKYTKPQILYMGKLEARAALCTGGSSPKHSVGLGCNAGNITS